ncbi:MAG: hypothetical protein ABIO65_07035 [Nitrospiria bacterium]
MRTGFVAVAWLILTASASVAAADAPPVSFGVELGVVSREVEEELPTGTTRGVVDSTRLVSRLGLQVAPVLLLFGEVGFADVAIEEFDDYRSDLHILYGGGARVILYDGAYPDRFMIYSDVKITRLQTDDRVTICTANCNDPVLLPTEAVTDEEIDWTEYAVSLGIRGGQEGFRPFGGVRYSRLDGTDHIQGEGTFDLRERTSLGFFLGADIFLDREERNAIMIQISGLDENAFRVGYKVSF